MNNIKVLHLLTSGKTGGIERLCFDIAKYSKLDNTFVFVTDGGIIYEQMKSLGYKVICLKSKTKFNLNKLNTIVNLSKENDILIVHNEDPILRLYYYLTKKKVDIKGIVVNHNCLNDESQIKYHGLKLKIYDSIIQKAFDISDEIWSVSKAGEISAKERYKIDDNKCRIIYNGISPDVLNKSKNNKISLDGLINITYIGRLVDIKGVDLLINAFDIIKDKYNVKLNIVGDGTDRNKLENLTKELNIENLVTFYGEQSDIDKYLKETDTFVYPSICEEIFGISIVEAMAYGIPCIANRVGGIPEIIEDGINGYLTKDKSANEIARLIENIINNKNIEGVSKKARKTAEKFSILNTCNQIEKEIRKLYDK